ncbi:hypothetical protein SAMN04489806_2706 [Paramicrobacterium humi]|uniref:DUF6993 domain-containing protein n=1 Tax=Paramicrobacterium humi TaxID=640635 RepID=A0A1H4Q431_9MICO|nr:hypothetical protein [Microbacterium humi]SEC14385.1 hypothetical protein SAMN04489806_2706 [Microbacterium humi]
MGTAATVRAAGLMLAVAASLVLAGCSEAHDADPVPPSAEQTTPTPTSTELSADADTTEALAYFDSVNRATLDARPDAQGRAIIDALVDAGFDPSAMQLTQDNSTVGNTAESIQFSVRWNDACLVGQNGPAVDGYHSVVTDVLADGGCLIGTTRTIDR